MTLKTIDTKRYGTLEFLIDEQDLHWLDKFNFYVSKQPTGFYLFKGSHKDIEYLHRLIMNAPKGSHVHHKNGNTLDNRRCNLEVLTPKNHSIETAKVNADLTEEQVKEILLYKGLNKDIAKKYNVTPIIISLIKRGKAYAWCCPDIPREEARLKRKTKKEMQKIKYLVREGINLKIISKQFNISMHDLYCIRKGTQWGNVIPILHAFTN